MGGVGNICLVALVGLMVALSGGYVITLPGIIHDRFQPLEQFGH
ncbi:hypothetical protein SDC9_188626 [bioreactor metagenome]|uniref:Uncharacterized protein n=1 Tax=bioreactor metagenome TaxID=1076179 RepID=A0A645HPV0_9ZZZZ